MIAHSLVVGKLEGMVGGMTDYWEVGDYFGLDNHQLHYFEGNIVGKELEDAPCCSVRDNLYVHEEKKQL